MKKLRDFHRRAANDGYSTNVTRCDSALKGLVAESPLSISLVHSMKNESNNTTAQTTIQYLCAGNNRLSDDPCGVLTWKQQLEWSPLNISSDSIVEIKKVVSACI